MEPLPRSFPIKAFKYLNGHANEFFWEKPSRKFHFLAVRVAFIADFKKTGRFFLKISGGQLSSYIYFNSPMKFGLLLLVAVLCAAAPQWGFFGHCQINRLAVFTLPLEVSVFYKQNLDYLCQQSTVPDKRRYAVKEEAPRHFIDLDHFDSLKNIPKFWKQAVEKYGEDTLMARGIVPWHAYREYLKLRDAFFSKNANRVLKCSAEIGHYIADAHVPLHTTHNYNGQETGQEGIHALWESRLPELNFATYDFFVGRASYIKNVQEKIWEAALDAHEKVDSVLQIEKQLYHEKGEGKFSFETKGRQTVKTVSASYADRYHDRLKGMVERQMRASIKMIGDVWYTAWVDAGQPDMKDMLNYKATQEDLTEEHKETEQLKAKKIKSRPHEGE